MEATKQGAWTAFVILLVLALFMPGCGLGGEEAAATAAPTPAPTVTPEPAMAIFDVAVQPTVEPPMLTPTPTPGPTEVPFSYYAPTVNMTFEELVGGTSDFGEINSSKVYWPKGYPPADTYYIIVDVYWQVIMIYTKDENGEYTVPVRYILCSTGDPGIKDGGETRRGKFQMEIPRVRFGHFLSGEAAQYWSLIRGRTYFHSILYEKQNNMSTYMVDTYEALGSKDSHGCIRMTVPDARWIWYHIAYGTTCEIRDGSAKDEATGAIRAQLVLPQAPTSRLKITAGATPYTDNWTIDTLLSMFPNYIPFKNEKQPPPANVSDDGSDDAAATPTPAGGGTGGATGDPGTVTPEPATPAPTAAPANPTFDPGILGPTN